MAPGVGEVVFLPGLVDSKKGEVIALEGEVSINKRGGGSWEGGGETKQNKTKQNKTKQKNNKKE